MEILLYVWVLNQQQNITRYCPKRQELRKAGGMLFNAETQRTQREARRRPNKPAGRNRHHYFRAVRFRGASSRSSLRFPLRSLGLCVEYALSHRRIEVS